MDDYSLKRVNALLEEYGNEVIASMTDYLSFTENLKNNIKKTVSDGVLEISMPGYALYVNDGRKPGSKMPPATPIKEWMERKSIPLSALYPIRRKIGRDGIKPRPFFHYFTDNLDKLVNDIADAFADDTEAIIKTEVTRTNQ